MGPLFPQIEHGSNISTQVQALSLLQKPPSSSEPGPPSSMEESLASSRAVSFLGPPLQWAWDSSTRSLHQLLHLSWLAHDLMNHIFKINKKKKTPPPKKKKKKKKKK